MYQRILVPLDGSKRAENILPHVEKLALCFKSHVIFLAVYRPPRLVGYEYTDLEVFQKSFEEQLAEVESYMHGVAGEFREKGIKSSHRVVLGPVVKEILNAADKEEADLIAICSHGRTGFSRLFYGSVAAGVLNGADRPLLIIRSGDLLE